jgi:GT2 family glycosyltransferase
LRHTPELSIILPTYNRASILPQAIRSVLAQDFQDWELIVWDDGSSDTTAEVIQSLGDKRIKYRFAENRGMSAALNRALEVACGEFIAFLDDDDTWMPEKSTRQLRMLKDNAQIDMVFGDYLNVQMASGKQGTGFSQNARAMQRLVTGQIGEQAWQVRDGFLESLAYSNYIAFDSVMLRREILDRIGPFNESLRNAMDFEYWWRFGLAGGNAAFTRSIVMKRMKYPRGLSSQSLATQKNHFNALDSCASLAMERGRDDLVSLLKPSYRNAWQNLITWHASQGDTRAALNAFKHSLKYGFRPGSVRLLLQALARNILIKPKHEESSHG